jgi:hypothetical protein
MFVMVFVAVPNAMNAQNRDHATRLAPVIAVMNLPGTKLLIRRFDSGISKRATARVLTKRCCGSIKATTLSCTEYSRVEIADWTIRFVCKLMEGFGEGSLEPAEAAARVPEHRGCTPS